MRYVRALLARIAGFFLGHRADDDLRDELQSHVDMETAENIRRGMPPEEARRQAMLASGGLTQAAEAVRDQRGLPWIETTAADTRYVLRTLRRSPAFTAVVVITLALGIGANTAIISVVRGVLLKPLPNREGDRLVYLRQSTDRPGGENITFSVPEVRDFRNGVRREHELAVRAALGAGVGRLRRLLLVETLFLAALGGTVGVAIAVGGVGLLTSLAERYLPRASEIRLDAVVLGFTLALSVAVALLLSFLASLPREGGVASWILSGGHRMSGTQARQRLQRGLVVVQVAVSVVLLAGAGLLTRTMMRLADVRTGLRTEEVLTMQVPLLTISDLLLNPAADAAAKGRYDLMRREIAGLPGVIEVGVGSPLLLRGSDVRLEVKAEGKSLAPGAAMPQAELRTADPTFFDAAGIPLLAGRPFAMTDGPGSGLVVIINRMLADQLFPGENPIGKRIAWTGPVLRFTPLSDDWRTIVGVAANTQDGGLDAEPRSVVFMPFTQFLAFSGGLVIRADTNVPALIPAATRIVRRLAPTAPIEQLMTIAQFKDRSVSPRRLNAALISSFGLLALIIAAVGIASVLAFSVSARTIEIGIRMSLGADPGRVLRMVLREGGVLPAIGLGLGVAGALFGARVIQGLLFGVAPHDPGTFIGVAVTMAAIGIVACWIPAHRAARIDPAITMRS